MRSADAEALPLVNGRLSDMEDIKGVLVKILGFEDIEPKSNGEGVLTVCTVYGQRIPVWAEKLDYTKAWDLTFFKRGSLRNAELVWDGNEWKEYESWEKHAEKI